MGRRPTRRDGVDFQDDAHARLFRHFALRHFERTGEHVHYRGERDRAVLAYLLERFEGCVDDAVAHLDRCFALAVRYGSPLELATALNWGGCWRATERVLREWKLAQKVGARTHEELVAKVASGRRS